MTRQVITNQQGRMINPLQAVLFIAALLVFIFTVFYRMAKSGSFSHAMATLVESLLIVSFFIFLGILLSYLIYFIYQRFHRGSRHQQVYHMFDESPQNGESAGTSDTNALGLESNDEVESQPNS